MKEIGKLKEQQPLVFLQLQNSFDQKQLSHAYLFEGDNGTGKKAVSLWLVKKMFCAHLVQNEPCNQCSNCVRLTKGEHPDVLTIKPEGQTIKIDQIRNLKAEFTKSGVETNQKVFLIEQADKMSISAANSLLKFLEEPIGKILVILETNLPSKILPTIRSRCQVLHFQSLLKKQLVVELTQSGLSEATATLLSELTNSFEKAVEISQDEWFNEAREMIQQWATYLNKEDLQAFIYVQKSMVKHFKEKEQQAMSFDLLSAVFHQQLQQLLKKEQSTKNVELMAKKIHLVLKAKQKWEANVSWQNVCEQLVLKINSPKLLVGG